MLLSENNYSALHLLEVSSLTQLRVQSPAAALLPCYSVVLAASRLYFGGPGQLARLLEYLPAQAEGQVLRFADALLYPAEVADASLLSLFHSAPAGEMLLLSKDSAAEIAFLLTSIAQAAGATLLREELLRAYLHALLLRCTSLQRQQLPSAPSPMRPGLFLRFRHLLEQYYTEWKSVAAYADQLCVTPNHLSVSIKRETGRPASDHIRQRIMQEAQRLVATHDAPLKEIAYQLGFEDVAHFSKLFKRCHGVSFSSFKAQARQRYAGLVAA